MKSMKNVITSLVVVAALFAAVGTGYAQQLDEKTQQALIDAINDEYKAKATYQKVIDTFGVVRPFTNIIKAEQQHIDFLLPLFAKYDVEVPKDEWASKVPAFATLQDAFEAGVQAEIDNATMYDEFFNVVQEQDILDVFKQLRDASQEKHLPAFQRNASRGMSGRGQGRNAQFQGKGRNAQAQGQGRYRS